MFSAGNLQTGLAWILLGCLGNALTVGEKPLDLPLRSDVQFTSGDFVKAKTGEILRSAWSG